MLQTAIIQEYRFSNLWKGAINNKKLPILILLFFFGLVSVSQTVKDTPHNLSVSGIGNTKSLSESEVCVFCHTTHSSSPEAPMWNKKTSAKFYTLYNSSTIQAMPGQPDGSSLLCLSCHDGTIALGSVLSKRNNIDFSEGVKSFKSSKNNLTTDLSDDHIISFHYNTALAYSDKELKDPMSLIQPVKLEKGKVQCTTCHNPHDNTFEKFLVRSDRYSELCMSCHDKEYWLGSSHRNSQAKWNGNGNNPWFHTEYGTVAENACNNCHNTHSAAGPERLMKYLAEENNCLDCHNGNVAETDIKLQLNKPFSHNVYKYLKLHDAAEDVLVSEMHAECEDCHNPHATRDYSAKAPFVKGYNEGTRGINLTGNPVESVQYEYEICFRCHSDNPTSPSGSVSRQIEQQNVRFEFDPSNPSFHPVASQGNNPDVISLISPYTESSIIYCTDCHASNGINSPKGPHGSIYPGILKYNYSTLKNSVESYQSYELCYQCHDRHIIISEQPNDFQSKVHYRHIVEEQTSCSVCHDAHGISKLQGNSFNNSNLINFDINRVSPVNGNIRYEDTGVFTGNCTLSCHGVMHNQKSY